MPYKACALSRLCCAMLFVVHLGRGIVPWVRPTDFLQVNFGWGMGLLYNNHATKLGKKGACPTGHIAIVAYVWGSLNRFTDHCHPHFASSPPPLSSSSPHYINDHYCDYHSTSSPSSSASSPPPSSPPSWQIIPMPTLPIPTHNRGYQLTSPF